MRDMMSADIEIVSEGSRLGTVSGCRGLPILHLYTVDMTAPMGAGDAADRLGMSCFDHFSMTPPELQPSGLYRAELTRREDDDGLDGEDDGD